MSSLSATELDPSTVDHLDFQPSEPEYSLPASALDRPLDMEVCDRETHIITVATAIFRVVKDEIIDAEVCEEALLTVRRSLTDPDNISLKKYDPKNSDPLSNRTMHGRTLGQASVRNALLVATDRHRANAPLDSLEEYARDQLILHDGCVERLKGMLFMWAGE